MNFPTLETKYTLIKLLEFNQAQLLCDYYQKNKDFLASWEPNRSDDFYTLEFWQQQVIDSISLFKSKNAIRFVALDKTETHVIATCSYSNIVWGCFMACHMGYSIDQSYQGKNIMYEVAQTTIKYIKDEVKLHRIMANYIPRNTRSEILLKRLGFKKEGYAKNYLKINGRWQDHILTSLILEP